MKCSGLSVVRDDNGEAIRNYIPPHEPLMKPCENTALRGAEKCLNHISNMERQMAQQSIFMQRHGKDVADLMFALDIEMNPMDGLMECVQVTGTMTRMFQLLVSELEEGPVTETHVTRNGDLVEMERPGLFGHDHNRDQAPHVLLNLLTMWTDRYMRACKMALDAGIDERMVRNAEHTSGVFISAFERALRSMPLSDEVKRNLSAAMAREVREGISASSILQLEVSTT
jgi:hypothetical protein